MSAGIYDINTESGSDFELNIQYTDYNEAPINVSGKSFVFSVKKSYLAIQDDYFAIYSNGTSVEGLLEFPDTDNNYGHITIVPQTGNLTIFVKKETISALPIGFYFYSLKIIDSNDTVILRGRFEIEGF